MALIRGRHFNREKQAITLALQDLHLSLAPELVEWFGYIKNHFPQSELEAKNRELIDKAVKKEFHRQAEWKGDWYNPGIPYIKLISGRIPYLDFSVDLYLVASLDVVWEDKGRWDSDECILIEPIKKGAGKFQISLDFLRAVAEGSLSQFERKEVEVGAGFFTWYVPALGKEVRLHDTFVRSIHDAFCGKPLGPALTYYGLASMRDSYLAEQKLLEAPSSALKELREGALSEAEITQKRDLVQKALIGKTLRLGAREAEAVLDTAFVPSLSVEENIELCLKSLH